MPATTPVAVFAWLHYYELKRTITMKPRRRRGLTRLIMLALALAPLGCAAGERPLADIHYRQERGLGVNLILPQDREWNSTDLTLWANSQGGG